MVVIKSLLLGLKIIATARVRKILRIITTSLLFIRGYGYSIDDVLDVLVWS